MPRRYFQQVAQSLEIVPQTSVEGLHGTEECGAEMTFWISRFLAAIHAMSSLTNLRTRKLLVALR
jgi:hypothetical protein